MPDIFQRWPDKEEYFKYCQDLLNDYEKQLIKLRKRFVLKDTIELFLKSDFNAIMDLVEEIYKPLSGFLKTTSKHFEDYCLTYFTNTVTDSYTGNPFFGLSQYNTKKSPWQENVINNFLLYITSESHKKNEVPNAFQPLTKIINKYNIESKKEINTSFILNITFNNEPESYEEIKKNSNLAFPSDNIIVLDINIDWEQMKNQLMKLITSKLKQEDHNYKFYDYIISNKESDTFKFWEKSNKNQIQKNPTFKNKEFWIKVDEFCKKFREESKFDEKIHLIAPAGIDISRYCKDLKLFSLLASIIFNPELISSFDAENEGNFKPIRILFLLPFSLSTKSISSFFGVYILEPNIFSKEKIVLPYYISSLYQILSKINSEISIISEIAKGEYELKKIYLKTAIISILVDSYAHNISAHSLAALKWWLEKRVNSYDERINISDPTKNNIIKSLENLKPLEISNNDLNNYAEKSDIYYKILGLGDSTNDDKYTSLLEIVKLMDLEMAKSLLSYEARDKKDEKIKLFRFPVPIDHGISKFIKFLRDKSAFWSGVTRDIPFGGEVKNLYDILWKDFADNPLYLGTIAHSEGINKLNVNIELPKSFFPNREGKNREVENNAKHLKFDFARINMDVIEFEDKLYSDRSTENESFARKSLKYKGLEKEERNTGSNRENENEPDKNEISYSKYALVYPGEDHKIIREELQKSDYNVFFPGGVVGEHALFTIFENTIRNVKHLNITDAIKNDGLNFNLRISPARLMNEKFVDISDDNHKLFKIEVYLDHDNTLFKSNEKENKIEVKRVTNILEQETAKPIVNENGSPRLGGNAQDKICASMLLNNRFVSVAPNLKPRTTERDNYYYNEDKKFYWIGFKDTLSKEKIKNLYHEIKNKKINNDVDNIINSKNYKGKLKKYFYLWKGALVKKLDSLDDLDEENLSRFKFLYLDSNIKKEFYKKLKSKDNTELIKQRPIRIITKDDLPNNYDFSDYLKKIDEKTKEEHKKHQKVSNYSIKNKITDDLFYSLWIKKSLHDLKFNIPLMRGTTGTPTIMIDGKSKEIIKYNDKGQNKSILCFAHGKNTDPLNVLDYRSHGILQKRFLKGKDDFTKIPHYKFEFMETITKRINIIDSRIFNRADDILREKLKNKLYLNILSEDKTIFNKSASKDSSIKDWNESILVIHLSYIESFENYNEKNISQFIQDKLEIKENVDTSKFLLILTTGRGRFEWIENLYPEHRLFTIFRPIESLLSAVEDGIIYKDDFQVKYNLLKVIYGS